MDPLPYLYYFQFKVSPFGGVVLAVSETLTSLKDVKQLSKDNLEALQVSRLRQTLQHVFDNSPSYREKFESAGVHPADLKNLQDLKKFPFKLDENDAVISYKFKGKTKFYKLKDLKKQKSIPIPSAPKQ